MSDNDVSSNVNRAAVESGSGLQETTAKFEQDVLAQGWRGFECRAPSRVPVLKFAAKSDMGQVRENNEDKFDFYEPEDLSALAARGCLYAVADGIGGAQAGQIASEMMLKTLMASYFNHPSPDPETAIRAAVDEANERIYALAQMIPERSGMGTTLTGTVFIEDRVLVVQVGDSRAYLVRDGRAVQVTQDHSWVEEQVRAGILSREAAAVSPFRNVITRSIGASPRVVADLYREEARVGDSWLLCSDGLSAYCDAEEIARIVSECSPSEAARLFIDIANSRGGHDNITVFVIAVRDLSQPAAAPSGLYGTAQNAHEENGSGAKNGSSCGASESGERVGIQIADSGGGDDAGSQSAPRGWKRLFGLGR